MLTTDIVSGVVALVLFARHRLTLGLIVLLVPPALASPLASGCRTLSRRQLLSECAYYSSLNPMWKKSCAAWLLILAVSPFTAPFQTCDIADFPSEHSDQTLTPPTSLADDDSVVAPLDIEAGRLKVTPLSDLAISHFGVVAPPVAPLALPLEPPHDISGYSAPPTVLRL